jgi:hypothetical protein
MYGSTRVCVFLTSHVTIPVNHRDTYMRYHISALHCSVLYILLFWLVVIYNVCSWVNQGNVTWLDTICIELMFLTVISSLINETNCFVISRPCYRGHSPDLWHHSLFFVPTSTHRFKCWCIQKPVVQPKELLRLWVHTTLTNLQKKPPATKSTPMKRSLCSSNKGITHLLDGMHSFHALLPFHGFLTFFSRFNVIPRVTS